jgi:hypothetical protein
MEKSSYGLCFFAVKTSSYYGEWGIFTAKVRRSQRGKSKCRQHALKYFIGGWQVLI